MTIGESVTRKIDEDGDLDIALVARMAAGDEAALTEFYDRHKAAVRGWLRRIVGDADADDMLHEVFLCVWRRARHYQSGRASVRAWLGWIARNKAIDCLRRRKRQALALAELEHDVPSPPSTGRVLDATRASALVAALPAEQRTTLEQAFLGGLSYSEIAIREHVALGTVKSRAARAMRTIRETLETPPSAGRYLPAMSP
jgi:RNA polymerase sigma-70 factor, ECF subfamily